MKKTILLDGEQYIRKKIFQKRWHKVMLVFCSIVVFCTIYALILPAITAEWRCNLPEHTHSDACYTQVVSEDQKILSCTVELHQHEEGCFYDFDDGGNPVCGYADFVVHKHDSFCFDEDGVLLCTLPEIEEHQHDDSCYISSESNTPPK